MDPKTELAQMQEEATRKAIADAIEYAEGTARRWRMAGDEEQADEWIQVVRYFADWELGGDAQLATARIAETHLRFPVQLCVPTTTEALTLLASTLNDFEKAHKELEVLSGSGGEAYSIVTDGRYAILLNAEGYSYPRYRSPRIGLHLLHKITEAQARRLCVRKSRFPEEFAIDTTGDLQDVAANPAAYTK